MNSRVEKKFRQELRREHGAQVERIAGETVQELRAEINSLRRLVREGAILRVRFIRLSKDIHIALVILSAFALAGWLMFFLK